MYHSLIHILMIRTFRDARTEDAFNGIVRKGFPADLIKAARRKLRYLNAASVLAIWRPSRVTGRDSTRSA